ncbi:tetratricopeptide repeat protein [Candidatus Poribacteria bacterium]|nr:tetratricopeptide repeat protein [Candidatus Poribacteria bacterium]
MRKLHQFKYTKLINTWLILTFILIIPIISISQIESEFKRGLDYVELRQYPEAVDIFNTILSRNPGDVKALFQLGNIYKIQDQLELSVETFNKIITELESNDLLDQSQIYGYSHLALSEIYCKQSKLDIAKEHALTAVEISPSDADTYYRIGYIHTHQAELNKAITSFQKALKLNPDFAEVYEWLGLIAVMQNKPKEAITHYNKAIQKKPYIQSSYYNLAKAYRLLGDFESAKKQLMLFQKMKKYYDKTYALEGFLAEDPLNSTLRMKLAETHSKHQHFSAAIDTYRTIIRLNPKYVEAYDKLGRLYMGLNIPDKAIPQFQHVLQLNPNAVEAYVRLGWLFNSQQKYEQAEWHLKKAIEKMPKLTLAYHGLAEIYTQQGRIEKAIQTYNTILEISPNDKEAISALQRLEKTEKTNR